MEELLKKINMPKSSLDRMDMYDVFNFKVSFKNFERIMRFDNDIKKYNKLRYEDKIKKEEYDLLVLSHIKYYYDLDFSNQYKDFCRMMYIQKINYNKRTNR